MTPGRRFRSPELPNRKPPHEGRATMLRVTQYSLLADIERPL